MLQKLYIIIISEKKCSSVTEIHRWFCLDETIHNPVGLFSIPVCVIFMSLFNNSYAMQDLCESNESKV